MLRELRTLLAIEKHGTFASAADRIGLTQSAVSAQMQRLEQQLGTPLFERTGRSATLNTAGREAARVAEEMVALYEKLRLSVVTPSLRGTLRIGAIQSTLFDLLPSVLTSLRGYHPDLRIHIAPGASLPLLSEVDSKRLDAAFVVRPTFKLPSELIWHPLLREPFVLVKRKTNTNPDWRSLIMAEPFIRYDSASFGGGVVDRFLKAQQLQPHQAIEAQDIEAIMQMVSYGLGVALVPTTRAQPPGSPLATLSLGTDTFYREVGMVRRQGVDLSGRINALIDAAQENVARSPNAHPNLGK